MDCIAKQPYFKIIREVTSIQQIDREDKRVLSLYKDRITTKHREFLIKDIINISYREFGEKNGLLYIHTHRGLFSYNIKTSPKAFIESYNNMVQ